MRLALRTVREKSPLTKTLLSQLYPSFTVDDLFLNKAIAEPLLIQLTLMRDLSSQGRPEGTVTLQGRVAFAFGLDCISVRDAVSTEKSNEEKINC